MSIWSIVVAAGTGARFGGAKQFAPLGGRRVLDWSLMAARQVSDGIVLVVPALVPGGVEAGADALVAGGPTRSASVRCGLAAVPAEAEVVVVHDAARPLAPVALFESVVAAVRAGADAAVPGVAVASTVKWVEGDRVVRTVDRASLREIQTPQAFAAGVLRRAHAGAREASDDAALVEEAGGLVVVVAGDPSNLKLTHPHDVALARAVLEGR